MRISLWPLCSTHVVFERVGETKRPMAEIEVRRADGSFIMVSFVVDTGSTWCTIPLPVADEYEIPYDQDPSRRSSMTTQAGAVLAHRGFLNVRVFGRKHTWPCGFVQSLYQIPVLGRIGFMDDYEVHVDRRFLTITRPGVFRILRRRLQERLHTHKRFQ